jgi:CheY-like chemotaxis protein
MGLPRVKPEMGSNTLMAEVLTTKSASSPESSDFRTALLAQKTALIGELAEATANQFNNIMMAITSYAELELKKAPPKGRRSLEQVLSNAGRATLLIQKLLAISRKQVSSAQPLELNSVITELSDLVRQIVGERIEVVLSLDPDIQEIKSDRVELEQLILSLALSARETMSAGGKLTVSTESVDLDNGFIGKSDSALPGKYTLLCVCDGSKAQETNSINQDLRINLALAAVHRMVEEAHGLVRISSDPAQGTSVKIYFPALSKEISNPSDLISSKDESTAKTILVVEDDDAVRVPAAEFLMMEGFKVLQARTGEEAIRVAQQNRSPLDLLVTDMVMPGMSGKDVAEQLFEICPGLKVLYMSGDAHQAASARGSAGAQNFILQKPFRLNKLKDKIREVLGY